MVVYSSIVLSNGKTCASCMWETQLTVPWYTCIGIPIQSAGYMGEETRSNTSDSHLPLMSSVKVRTIDNYFTDAVCSCVRLDAKRCARVTVKKLILNQFLDSNSHNCEPLNSII